MYLIAFAAGWFLARLAREKAGLHVEARRRRRFPVLLHARHHSRRPPGLRFLLWHAVLGNDPWYPLKITDGGMSFHGGLIGVMVALADFCR
jgi:phosphatidylglycerol:prolipoprotein diacylglycerol transferase